jgi:CubicO group peptidase (beta-lactamase class C family)
MAHLQDTTRRRVDAAVAAAQRDWRSPNVSAAVVRDGDLVHSAHVGLARLDPPQLATDDTRWLIGSVTKTFTGVLVMALRDAGRLELDAPVGDYLPLAAGTDPAVRSVTIRRLLGHVSGLQREVEGRMWESLRAPGSQELLGDLARVRPVLPASERYHYSNLGYAVLGLVIEQLEGRPWAQVVRERVLDPLGMTRTVVNPGEDRAGGYFVHPWTGVAHPEPVIDLGATVPMGGLWSTLTDLGRYAAFLAGPPPGTSHGTSPGASDRGSDRGSEAPAAVLADSTVELMCQPQVVVDPQRWTMAHGLALGMVRHGERIYVGHSGAMPGFVTGLRISRADRLGAVVWANSSAGAAPVLLAAELLDLVLDAEPTVAPQWRPEQAPPAPLAELVGPWWSEGEELLFTVRAGQLWCWVRSMTVDSRLTGRSGIASSRAASAVRHWRSRVARTVGSRGCTWPVTPSPESPCRSVTAEGDGRE